MGHGITEAATMGRLRTAVRSPLVFCTDGLVESATRDTEEGLVQLRRTLAEEVSRTPYFDVGPQDDGGDLGRLCDHVVSAR